MVLSVSLVSSTLQQIQQVTAPDGLFLMVEKKENEIRDKVSARSSGLLQKVFGYADQFKSE